MIAIQTKYLGPTNTKGTRIKAHDGRGNQITVSRDYSVNADENHRLAAIALCEKMKWKANFATGQLNNDTMVHVFIDAALARKAA